MSSNHLPALAEFLKNHRPYVQMSFGESSKQLMFFFSRNLVRSRRFAKRRKGECNRKKKQKNKKLKERKDNKKKDINDNKQEEGRKRNPSEETKGSNSPCCCILVDRPRHTLRLEASSIRIPQGLPRSWQLMPGPLLRPSSVENSSPPSPPHERRSHRL